MPMTLTPNEQLTELKSLFAAVTSQRASVARVLNDRNLRHHRIRNVVQRIRGLLKALGQAFSELQQLRSTNTMRAEVAACDKRLAILRRGIIEWEQRVRIERLLRLKAQMEALNMELPEQFKLENIHAMAPAEPDLSEDIDDDLIIS